MGKCKIYKALAHTDLLTRDICHAHTDMTYSHTDPTLLLFLADREILYCEIASNNKPHQQTNENKISYTVSQKSNVEFVQ